MEKINWMSKERREHRYKLLLQESKLRHGVVEVKKPVPKKEIDWNKLNQFHIRKNIS